MTEDKGGVGRRTSKIPGLAFVAAALLSPSVLMYSNKGMVAVLCALALLALPAAVRVSRLHGAGNRIVLAAGLVLLAWGAASAGWAHTPGLALPKALRLLALSGMGWVAVTAARGLEDATRRKVLTALAIGWIVAAGAALLENWSSFALTSTIRPMLTGIPWQPGYIELSQFKNLGSAGAVLAVAAIGAAWARRTTWQPAAALAVAVLVAAVAAVVVTHSYTGAAALAAGLSVTILLPAWAIAVAISALVIALAATLPFVHLLPDTAVLAGIAPWAPSSLMHRTAIWQFAAERAREQPWLGWGLDGSREIPGGQADFMLSIWDGSRMISYPTQILPLHPHNFLLQVWLELGAVGVVLMLAALAAVVHAIRALDRRSTNIATAVMVTAITIGAASFSLWQSWWVATIWLAAALTLATRPPSASLRP